MRDSWKMTYESVYANNRKIHVFIVGSKGIPARYGGFETFVEELTKGKVNPDIQYHVSCMANDEHHFVHNGADCFNVSVPLPGAPGRILHVGLVLEEVEKWIERNRDEQVIVYILGCRIGPLLIPHAKRLRKLGAKLICNPDGLEWKRQKWNAAEKIFLKYCEKCLVENSDLSICDSRSIEQYIRATYGSKVKNTTFIAYGANSEEPNTTEEQFEAWIKSFKIRKGEYYLIVGRFVPDNNYETMISEFVKSSTKKDLVIITNIKKNSFYKELAKKTGFESDPRIKFVGTVYDQDLLKTIRRNAFAYLHGHEVGGTNPSLLEALAFTPVNLVLNVGFNREVGQDAALYWTKESGSLSALISQVEELASKEFADQMHQKAAQRIADVYNWKSIIQQYEAVFAFAYMDIPSQEESMAF